MVMHEELMVKRMINASSRKESTLNIEGVAFQSRHDVDVENLVWTLGELYHKHGVFTGAFLRSWGRCFGWVVRPWELETLLDAEFYPYESVEKMRSQLSEEEAEAVDWDSHFQAPEGVIFTR